LNFNHKTAKLIREGSPALSSTARRERLAQLMSSTALLLCPEIVPSPWGWSEATARRDLAALVLEKKITRTYGGKVVGV